MKEFLAEHGVPREKIAAIGLGKSEQVKACTGVRPQQALRDCLLPNRRVVVDVLGVAPQVEATPAASK